MRKSMRLWFVSIAGDVMRFRALMNMLRFSRFMRGDGESEGGGGGGRERDGEERDRERETERERERESIRMTTCMMK